MRDRLDANGWRTKGAVFLLLLLGLILTDGRLLRAADATVSRTTLAVERISCGACLRVIDSELRKVPGILGMTADLPTRLVTVDHESSLSPAGVAAAITTAGYPAQVVNHRDITRGEAKLFQRDPGFGSGLGCCNPGGTNPIADAWRELCRRLKGERGCNMGRPQSQP